MKYMVHKNGKIFVLKNGKYREKKQVCSNGNYPRIGAYFSDGTRKDFLVHRLLATGYLSNLERKPCVNHINGIKTDNRISNLEWCTYKENTAHSRTNGLQKSGHRGGCLSWDSYEKRWSADIQHNNNKYRKVSKDKDLLESWIQNKLSELEG